MFLHGWGQSSECFSVIADYLAKNNRVTLIDFSGFGKTKEPSQAMTISDYAREVIEIIKQNNMENVVIIAHSFGGRVALEMAYKYPHFFSVLILADIAGIRPKRTLKYYYKIYTYKLRKKLKLDTTNAGSNDYKKLTKVMKQTFVNVVNYNQTYQLNKIFLPTLIVWGELDTETPIYMAKILHKKLANSRLVVFEDCTHFAFLEDMYRFIIEINEFLDYV